MTKQSILIIGGGTMGTAAGWHAARQGHHVTILEQFTHYHTFGSHSGNTRIYRHAYAEGAFYVPISIASTSLWRELQNRTGLEILIQTGCLDISSPGQDRAVSAHRNADAHQVPSEVLTGADVNSRWSAWNIPPEFEANFDPEAGIILLESAFAALRSEYIEAGGTLLENQRVRTWHATTDGVHVVTDTGTLTADTLIVTAGAWTSKILPDLSLPLEVRRTPVLWFGTAQPELFDTAHFPSFVYQDHRGNEFFGLPAHGNDSVKLGIHSGGDSADPDQLDREIRERDLPAEFTRFLNQSLPAVTMDLTASSMCMYTMTPDQDFIIDRHPNHQNVLFACGFSGHGFKFAPWIGKHLTDLATGNSQPDPHFRLDRFF